MYSTRIPTIKHWADAARPRERFLNESGTHLSNAELIAILIGSGSADESAVDLAHRMLYSVDNDLERFSRLSIQDLSHFKGIGFAKAVSIAAAFELCYNRMNLNTASSYHPQDMFRNHDMIKAELSAPDEDTYWVFLFAGSGMLQHKEKVGDQHTKFGDTKTILQIALAHECTSILLVQQCLEAISKPDRESLAYTNRLIASANMLSLVVLDRIMVNPEGEHYSYRSNGQLEAIF